MNIQEPDIIEIKNLSRHFNEKAALKNVSLKVPRGRVFGVIGENGAGKTTLIKHILGLYKAQQGTVSVFGRDPVEQPREVLSRIGYLSEQPDLPEWMTVLQLMNYMAAFYVGWDKQYAAHLVDMFNIDQTKRTGELSKGQRARVGLCVAQSHRPELLLLDEPSSGLDPVARYDILTAIIRTVVDEGRSVLLSSHLLDEVERVCDYLVMLDEGKVTLSEPMDKVLSDHYQISLRYSGQPNARLPLGVQEKHGTQGDAQRLWENTPGVFKAVQGHGEWQLYCFADIDQVTPLLQAQGGEILEQRQLSLNEAFIARSNSKSIRDEVA